MKINKIVSTISFSSGFSAVFKITVICFLFVISFICGSTILNEICNSSEHEISAREQKAETKKTQRLPDAMIVGVKKGGTMTLAAFLNHHPNIVTKGGSGINEYFYKRALFSKGKRYYIKKMPKVGKDKVLLLNSPKTLSCSDVMTILSRQKGTKKSN